MVVANLRCRTGNQLFQICCAIAYAMKHNLPYHIPDKTLDGNQMMFPSLTNPLYNERGESVTLYENSHGFEEIKFFDDWREQNIYINGWRQSEKYFKEYWNEIRPLLKINYKENSGVVSIHKRLGDYKQLKDYFPIISENYIAKAIHHFIELGYRKFKVFSDEVSETRNTINSNIYNSEFEYSEGKSSMEDLEEMSSCSHQICSNSSFSWWAYYLNQNKDKIGIFPSKWFGSALPLETKDIYPENAIIY